MEGTAIDFFRHACYNIDVISFWDICILKLRKEYSFLRGYASWLLLSLGYLSGVHIDCFYNNTEGKV